MKNLLVGAVSTAALLSAFVFAAGSAVAQMPAHKTENIIYVMTDGLRWQEVFNGADAALMNKEHGKVEDKDLDALKKKYWRESVEERRLALMPFVWTVAAKQGQIYGDLTKGSDAHVTNTLNFSYPGYSETWCGFVDPRVNSNDKVLNPSETVLEWLNHKDAFHGRIAAFAAWDVMPFILDAPRSGLLVNAGYDPLTAMPMTPRLDLLNHLKAETPRFWDDEPFDPIPFYTAMEYLKAKKPRVLFLSLGDTDDCNYAEYLNAAHRADDYVRVLWETVQSMPEYRGKTTIVFSPDHGRGEGLDSWKDHGPSAAHPEKKWPGLPESKRIWMVFMGPDTPALGERTNIAPVEQTQLAATVAALLGQDYDAAVPKAGKPIAEVFKH
jgi:hypothetical protein